MTMDKLAVNILILLIQMHVFITNTSTFDQSDMSTLAASKSSKFRLDHIEPPPPGCDKMADFGTIRSRKFNRSTFVINGYYDLLIPFTDDLIGKGEVYEWQGNEYRKQGDRTLTKLCTMMQNEKTYKPKLINYTNVDPDFACPFQPTRIAITDLPMPDLPVSFIKSDRFRVNVSVTDPDGVCLLKYAAYLVRDE